MRKLTALWGDKRTPEVLACLEEIQAVLDSYGFALDEDLGSLTIERADSPGACTNYLDSAVEHVWRR